MTTLFVTDADNREVLEYDGTGATQRWYAYGQGSNEVLSQMNVAAGTRASLIPDIQGSIIGSLDSGTGTLTKTGYGPYGESPVSSGGFRYAAMRLDRESVAHCYAHARMCSTAWANPGGRFRWARREELIYMHTLEMIRCTKLIFDRINNCYNAGNCSTVVPPQKLVQFTEISFTHWWQVGPR